MQSGSGDSYATVRHMLLEDVARMARETGAETGRTTLNPRVMEALGRVARHRLVPADDEGQAYRNSPLSIGFGQTISQPFIVALMTDMLDIQPDDVVLEIGTGLGYQAAIAAALARKVFSVEMIEELSQQAGQRLARLGVTNVERKIGNGFFGWAEHAPFDKIIVTAAPDLIPPVLLGQLKPGGKMVIPAGLPDAQQLILVDKDAGGRVATKEILPVRFSQLEGIESDRRTRDVQ